MRDDELAGKLGRHFLLVFCLVILAQVICPGARRSVWEERLKACFVSLAGVRRFSEAFSADPSSD